MRGLDHLELSLNFLNYEYKGVTYQYIPQYWFQDWLTPILSWILDLWVVILILSILRKEARDRMVGIFLMLSYLVAVVNHFVSSRFYPIKHSYHLLYSSTTAWWIVAMAVSSLSTWIIYRSLERGFRPSLMPIVIYLTMSLLHVGMFERPSDGYSIISHVLGAGAVWLLLRKSKWGVEKWTEYQQGQETLQT